MHNSCMPEIALLSSLPCDEVGPLLKRLRRVELAAGSVVIREGDRGDKFYILLEGQLEIVKAMGTPDERLLSVREPGDYVGEMSLLDPEGLRTASIRTRTRSSLLELNHGDFEGLLLRHPGMAWQMARMLSQRLKDTDNATIRDLQAKNRELDRAYRELKAAHAQIVEKEKLERELEVAREIQESILPRSVPRLPGFDFGALMVPARAVGGDLFDFIPLSTKTLGIAVGDVSDKGVPAAIFMAMTRSLIRSEAKKAVSPKEALAGVNRHLMEMNDAGMFVTVLYGVLDLGTGEFSYARAGHLPPLLCGQTGSVYTPVVSFGQALGIIADPVLDESSLTVGPGSTLMIFTDGLTEATDERDRILGEEGVRSIFSSAHGDSAQEICGKMVEAALLHCGAMPQSDDMTVVAIRAAKTASAGTAG